MQTCLLYCMMCIISEPCPGCFSAASRTAMHGVWCQQRGVFGTLIPAISAVMFVRSKATRSWY
jgi:hypothetical protein